MLLKLFDAAAFRTAHEALSGLSQRQAAIAANIANIDTPNYQRRDVSFEETLRAQLSGAEAATGDLTLGRTDARHLDVEGAPGGGAHILGSAGSRPRDVVAARNDQNSVSVDEEMTLLVDTQLRYQALSQSLGTRLSTLRTVIRGQ